MSFRQIVSLLALLVFSPLLTLGQKVADSGLNSKVIDLYNKTFIIDEEGKINKTGNDLHLFLIFHQDGTAVFRGKRGNTITKDSPLSWRFVGDSLYLQHGPISLVADGKTQYIAREPMKFSIVKTSGGYLLKDKGGQMLLFEIN